jgi:hypothetical protein
MYITLKRVDLFNYALIALISGFALSQIGMYMANRWGRSPRPDEQLDASLKGLPGDYTLYHYQTPVFHLLVGAAGIWVLIPYRQSGQIIYEKGRWKVRNGGFIQSYMSIFGQEGIGRPDLEVESEISSLKKLLAKKMDGNAIPPIHGALVFTSKDVKIDSNDAPVPAMHIDKLKGFIRQKAKEAPLSTVKIAEINEALK